MVSNDLTLPDAQKHLQDIGLPLRTHQLEGVETILRWHADRHGGILADEMGLGKTCEAVVSLAILSSTPHTANQSRALIICPLSVIDHWENELKRFSCGLLEVFRYYGSKERREEIRSNLQRKARHWNVLLTTFEIYLKDYGILPFSWDFAVFDEAHRVKNELSLMHQAIAKSKISWMLLMTGTPVQNKLTELYSLLELIDPASFPDDRMKDFVNKYKNSMKDEKVGKEFHLIFNKYCLRRTKEILAEVPPCSEVILYHGISKLQYDLYKAILSNNREFFVQNTNSMKNSRQSLMSVLVQLKKACNHPYLFPGIEKEPFVEGEHLITASGKTLILDRLLVYLFAKKHKVLVFSQMSRYLDIVADCLTLRGYKFEHLDGSTKTENRLRAVENFQRPNSDVFCFLLTTKAGGIGLNLTAADTVIFLDWDFNPQNDKQAAARCHRIGQDKPVKVIRLIAKHTVEELIKYRASQKLKLSEFVLGENDNEGKAISQAEFADLLLGGLKDLEQAELATLTRSKCITDEELERMIGTTKRKGTWVLQKTDQKSDLWSEGNDEEEEAPVQSMYVFEGRNYAEDRQIFEKITQESNDENVNILNKVARKATLGYDTNKMLSQPLRPRKVLTEEEKEERRQRRKELEEERRVRREAEMAERKRALWERYDYKSMNLQLPTDDYVDSPIKPGSIYNVLGDVTKPERSIEDTSEKALILQTVDDGGHYGVGGMFTALRNLSSKIPDRYELIARVEDLHCGDSHLIADFEFEQQSTALDLSTSRESQPKGQEGGSQDVKAIQRIVSIVLMTVQSVQDRYRKMISKESLGKCLKRVRRFALENDAKSVHMPMIWFGIQNLDEPTVKSMLTRQLCAYGVNVYIYKFNRRGGNRLFRQQQKDTSPRAKSPSSPPVKRARPTYIDSDVANEELDKSEEKDTEFIADDEEEPEEESEVESEFAEDEDEDYESEEFAAEDEESDYDSGAGTRRRRTKHQLKRTET